ncbi:MAG: metalloregulator ArsR/SmtB family transcription factor [Actinobacteria bacterium]|nr:metalloregulator ArsR/SmtB family transcription factor [Actinomycetota bacterium]
MAGIKPGPLKCTTDECRQVARHASGIHPVLNNAKMMAERARLFQALGNETRLKVLGLLSAQELCTCDIAVALGAAASTLAHHLRMLQEAEWVSARQEGKFTFYSLNADALKRHRVFEGSTAAREEKRIRRPRPAFAEAAK